MLCRYDTMALKSLDIFSVHGFPVSLVQCESNLLGIVNGSGGNVGSGGWSNIVDKFVKAKRYCDSPYEVRYTGSRKFRVPIDGERIGGDLNGARRVSINCGSATTTDFAPGALDAVFTDPPYLGNVQYGELMDFCYVWLRRIVGNGTKGFDRPSTRSSDELTANVTQERGLEHFTEGLSKVYSQMADALKPGVSVGVHLPSQQARRLLRGGRRDSGCPPCLFGVPALSRRNERIDSYSRYGFFYRRYGFRVPNNRRDAQEMADRLIEVVRDDLSKLETAGRTATYGDTRCIVFGHLTRMAVWELRNTWTRCLPTAEKIAAFRDRMTGYGDPDRLARRAMEG